MIGTRNLVTLITLPYEIPRSICLLCKLDPPYLTLLHLSLMNSSIPMSCNCSNVFSLLTLAETFSISKEIAAVISFILNLSEIFSVIFDIASIVFFCFLKQNCLSSIFSSFPMENVLILLSLPLHIFLLYFLLFTCFSLTLYALNYFSKMIESNNFHSSNRHDFWSVTKRPQQRMLQNYTRRKQNMYPTCHVRF